MFICIAKDRPQQSRDGLLVGTVSRAILRQYYCLPLQAGAARQPAKLYYIPFVGAFQVPVLFPAPLSMNVMELNRLVISFS